MTVTRGTSNRNVRGSAEQRRRRKEYLLEVYRADMDAITSVDPDSGQISVIAEISKGHGEKACRCYRCGRLLVFATLTVDKIIPQCLGGTYRRENIRPACGGCNSETGGALARGKEHQAAKRAARRRAKKSVGGYPSSSRLVSELPPPPPLPPPGVGLAAPTYSVN